MAEKLTERERQKQISHFTENIASGKRAIANRHDQMNRHAEAMEVEAEGIKAAKVELAKLTGTTPPETEAHDDTAVVTDDVDMEALDRPDLFEMADARNIVTKMWETKAKLIELIEEHDAKVKAETKTDESENDDDK